MAVATAIIILSPLNKLQCIDSICSAKSQLCDKKRTVSCGFSKVKLTSVDTISANAEESKVEFLIIIIRLSIFTSFKICKTTNQRKNPTKLYALLGNYK